MLVQSFPDATADLQVAITSWRGLLAPQNMCLHYAAVPNLTGILFSEHTQVVITPRMLAQLLALHRPGGLGPASNRCSAIPWDPWTREHTAISVTIRCNV